MAEHSAMKVRRLKERTRTWRRESKHWPAARLPVDNFGEELIPHLRHGSNRLVREDSEFPHYSLLRPEHISRGMYEVCMDFQRNIEKLLITRCTDVLRDEDGGGMVRPKKLPWIWVMELYEFMLDRVDRVGRTIAFMKDYVDPSPRMLREFLQSDYDWRRNLRILQTRAKFLPQLKRLLMVYGTENEARRRLVAMQMILFDHMGANLEEDLKPRGITYKQYIQVLSIQRNLANVSVQWEVKLKNSREERAFLMRDYKALAGLPLHVVEDMSTAAATRGYPKSTPTAGPWMMTFDDAMADSVMRHSTNRDLRERVWFLRSRLGFTGGIGEDDTSALLKLVLQERLDFANILGFANWANVQFPTKMATKEQVYSFISRLRRASLPVARRELDELQQFARAEGEQDDLDHFDLDHWRERLIEHRFGLRESYLREFFQFPLVLEGLFGLLRRLFGVRVVSDEAPPESIYDKHVSFYRIVDDITGEVLGSFFLDPYRRRWRKKPGFAMEVIQQYSRAVGLADNDTSARLPAVHLIFDLAPPGEERPTLLTVQEVAKVFHTMGAALRTLLSDQEEGLMSGDQFLELDFVEMPAFFLERWAYDKATLRSMSRHIETGDPLPDAAIDTIIATRSFHGAIGMLRRAARAQVDIDLHNHFDPNGTIPVHDITKLIEAEFSVIPPRMEAHELNSYPIHGERGCGLYSELWSEALAADAFAVFEEAGLDNEEAVAELGGRLRDCILGPAAGRNPTHAMTDFLQRPTKIRSFFESWGLAQEKLNTSAAGEPPLDDEYEDVYDEEDGDYVPLEDFDYSDEVDEDDPDGYDDVFEEDGDFAEVDADLEEESKGSSSADPPQKS